MFDMRTGVLDWAGTEEADLQSILDEEDNVKTRIIFAREELKVGSLLDLFHKQHTSPLRTFLCASIVPVPTACCTFFSICHFPLGRHCNYLPTRSSTCAKRLVVRKPKDNARKSSRVKWRELPPVSSGEPSTQSVVQQVSVVS